MKYSYLFLTALFSGLINTANANKIKISVPFNIELSQDDYISASYNLSSKANGTHIDCTDTSNYGEFVWYPRDGDEQFTVLPASFYRDEFHKVDAKGVLKFEPVRHDGTSFMVECHYVNPN